LRDYNESFIIQNKQNQSSLMEKKVNILKEKIDFAELMCNKSYKLFFQNFITRYHNYNLDYECNIIDKSIGKKSDVIKLFGPNLDDETIEDMCSLNKEFEEQRQHSKKILCDI